MSKTKLDLHEIGKRLKEARKAVNMTQEKMGELYGFPHTAISEMESGKRNAQLKYLILLINQFNINLNWIFTGKGLMFRDFEIRRDFGDENEKAKDLIDLVNTSPEDRYKIFQFITSLKQRKKE